MDQRTPSMSVFHCLPQFVQTHVGSFKDTVQPSCPLWSSSPCGRLTTLAYSGFCNNKKVILASIGIVSLVSLIIFIISRCSCALSGISAIFPTALPSPSTAAECCPDGWIGYQRKCYYFSESEENWTHSQNYCASFDASLVMIDSQEEMSFLRRYKGPDDHWIGLQRTDDEEPWRLINGIIFNNWFKIRGPGPCAYLNHQGVASASGANKEYWICRKPVGK